MQSGGSSPIIGIAGCASMTPASHRFLRSTPPVPRAWPACRIGTPPLSPHRWRRRAFPSVPGPCLSAPPPVLGRPLDARNEAESVVAEEQRGLVAWPLRLEQTDEQHWGEPRLVRNSSSPSSHRIAPCGVRVASHRIAAFLFHPLTTGLVCVCRALPATPRFKPRRHLQIPTPRVPVGTVHRPLPCPAHYPG